MNPGPGEKTSPRPRSSWPPTGRGLRGWLQAGLESYRAGQRKEAAAACTEALLREPRHFWARYVRALCQLQDRQWADARESLTLCLDRRHDFVWALLLSRFCRERTGPPRRHAELFAAARADLDHALQQDRTPLVQWVGRVNRGVLFIRQRQWPKAIADLQEAIRLKDDGYPAYLNLARAYQGSQQGDKALAVLTQAIGKAPRLAVLHKERARLHQERNDLPAARADFEEVVRLEAVGGGSPRLAGILLELGLLLKAAGTRWPPCSATTRP